MKNKFKYFVFVSCTLLFCLPLLAQSLWVPPGAKVSGSGQCQSVQASGDWSYLAIGQDGRLYEGAKEVTICCDCTSNNGTCLPGGSGTKIACLSTNGCIECRASYSLAIGTGIRSGGFVQYNAGVSFVDQSRALPALFPGIEKSDRFIQAVTSFQQKMYGTAQPPPPLINDGIITAPKGYKLARVQVFGRGGLIVVPDKTVIPSAAFVGSGKCRCSDGTCTYFSRIGYYGCDGDCRGICCMSSQADGSNLTEFYNY
jgi:hypothetical protein